MKKARFIRYLAVGVLTFALDYVLFVVGLRLLGLGYLLANVLGFIGGFLSNFLLNGRYTFDLRAGFSAAFVRYCLLALFSLGLGSVLLHALVQGPSLAPELAKFLVAGMTVCWNFVLYRHFVFRQATV